MKQNIKEDAIFAKEFGGLLSSGINLETTVKVVGEEMPDYKELGEAILQGNYDAMDQYSPFLVEMIKYSADEGKLDKALEDAAGGLEREVRFGDGQGQLAQNIIICDQLGKLTQYGCNLKEAMEIVTKGKIQLDEDEEAYETIAESEMFYPSVLVLFEEGGEHLPRLLQKKADALEFVYNLRK